MKEGNKVILKSIHGFVWGLPALVGILGVGLLLTLKTRFVQLRLFPRAIRQLLRKPTGEGISPFRALCTALAATVGTGNLIGVAGAIAIGGPGAIFWMWVSGFLGMATKFAEVTLAVHYRTQDHGEYLGGPMYILPKALGNKWMPLAVCYALLGLAASFGVGNAVQINAVASGIQAVIPLTPRMALGLGLLLAVALGAVLWGGAKRIGAVAEVLIPVLSVFYLLLCMIVLFLRREAVGNALLQIFRGAFSPSAVTGGAVGSVFGTLRTGCSRGVFTNEAGMGTASMAHACAEAENPVDQGCLGILEVFLDTIVICTMTALVILVSGVPIPYGSEAPELTSTAFSAVCGSWAGVFLAVALGCFAFATVLGWGLYGSRCAVFLFGHRSIPLFTLAQVLTVVLGTILNTQKLWLLAETLNGMMALPNLLMLILLLPEITSMADKTDRASPGPPEKRILSVSGKG